MKSVSAQAPTLDELQHLIECAKEFKSIELGDVANRCAKYSASYSELLASAGIDHVLLGCYSHKFLAVKTKDRGTVIFDPTFQQYYPTYDKPYFLDTQEELLRYATEHGGMNGLDAPIPSYHKKQISDAVWVSTANLAFMKPAIEQAPFCPKDPKGKKLYMDDWAKRLEKLNPLSPERDLINPNDYWLEFILRQKALSSKLVSP